MRILGDSHGEMDQYLDYIKNVEYSVHLGDISFDYAKLKYVDPVRHRLILGNHENYENIPPHSLGDFGTHTFPNGKSFFFVRGGRSIDRAFRTQGIDWFPQEELTTAQGNACIDAYEQAKPDIVLSHECPSSIIPFVSNFKGIQPSYTAQLLQFMLGLHKPKFYFFAHHHVNWWDNIEGTQFRCVGEGKYYDF